jgi:glycosyltransferase involved in cell wall biosynthesis
LKVLVKAAFSPFSGYGNDGLGIVQALDRAGVDVVLHPMHVDAPLPRDVALMLTQPLEPPFDLILHHADPYALGVPYESRNAAGLVIGWSMWEWSSFEADDLVKQMAGESPETDWDKRLGSLDGIVMYDEVGKQAIETVAQGMSVGIQQGGYDASRWKPVERDWYGDRFAFCMVGQLHERKDPFVAIEAFRELKMEQPGFEGAELHLKTSIPGLHSKLEEYVPKCRVHYAQWQEDILRAFYGSMHCLLAPSRGEGKLLPALEFMSTGGVVIATDWGGMRQWLSSQYAYPLKYTLVNDPAGHSQMSARADKEHLKRLMWQVYTRRAEARNKGEIAANVIPKMCSWDTVMYKFFELLAKLIPGRGEACRSAFLLAGGRGR